jgi:ATP-binding cassette subfamily F protein uup
VAQRGRGVDARATNPSPMPQKSREINKDRDESTSTTKRKLSFNEKRLLETLPERIDALGRDIEKLKALLADPELYTRDRARFDKASELLTRAEDERQKSETQWPL